MPSGPSLAYIIPTYGHFDYALTCLRSVLCDPEPLEVLAVLVDDASPNYARNWWHISNLPPRRGVLVTRFPVNGGLTRSWNHGLSSVCRDQRFDLITATNSDVIFPSGWWREPLKIALRGHTFVGPLSNAPGVSNPQQNVRVWYPEYKDADANVPVYADAVNSALRTRYADRFEPGDINGFCMAAAPSTWRHIAHDLSQELVFPATIPIMPSGRVNPWPTMAGQECWLSATCRQSRVAMGLALGSFVFHYRSVSRGNMYKRGPVSEAARLTAALDDQTVSQESEALDD